VRILAQLARHRGQLSGQHAIIMESMSRSTWTDSRLDDLNHKVDDFARRTDTRFDAMDARMDARFDAMDARMDARFDAMDARMDVRFDQVDRRVDDLDHRMDSGFDAMNSRFDAMNARFDALQRMMFQAAVAMIVAFLTAGAAIIATQL
jgi:flagellar capping protein FliD